MCISNSIDRTSNGNGLSTIISNPPSSSSALDSTSYLYIDSSSESQNGGNINNFYNTNNLNNINADSHFPTPISPTLKYKSFYHTSNNKQSTSSSPLTSLTTPWKKLLWVSQQYPDNYTDTSFLSQLKRNSTVVNYSYWKLISDFTLIVLHLSIIVMVILVFFGIYKLNWNPVLPTMISTILTILGFIMYVITLKVNRTKELIKLQELKITELSNINNNNNNNNINTSNGSYSRKGKLSPSPSLSSRYRISSTSQNSSRSSSPIPQIRFSSTNMTSKLNRKSPPPQPLSAAINDSPVSISATSPNNAHNGNSIQTPSLKDFSKSNQLLVNSQNANTKNIINLENLLTEPNPPDLLSTFKSSMLILLLLLTFSPVLKSLTYSTASDSIWALSTWLCILNVLFNDYSIDFPKNNPNSLNLNLDSQVLNNINTRNLPIFSKSNFSKNISLSNAIVLASRLNSNLSAFCFIVFSIEVTGFFPIFNNFTRRSNLKSFHWFQVSSIVIGVDYAILKIFGAGWFTVWISLHFLIVIIGPWYFILLQKYKDELQGPWDPAKPVVKSSF
ncbi:unnamed protein product [[Candida] boidinii]|nr:hypothetical protein B5S30_g1369 [[Candida] boidinii]GMF54695.1 unnamed protein product [[Candida] boidinii]